MESFISDLALILISASLVTLVFKRLKQPLVTENAEVKVLSSAQQLVARGNSVGGSWQWDLSQQNTGKRVAPGVYYIMVAPADGKTSVATKVVVM